MPTQELVATDPAQVGRYRLLRRLGSGGMGVVYLGETGAGDLAAVKCLPPGVSGETRGRLQREATYLAQVRHPRVAAFVDADVHADRPWIAMQYVAGPSLAQASVPLGPAQLRHLTEGIADALAALHREGLTHRDVKPGNVILTHDGPVLVDLGIAAGGGLTALTAVGMVIGTPEWMAPEQLSGSGSTHAIDVWGWAAVATYAATGRPPFGNGAIEALAYRIRQQEPDLRGVPDWLRDALLGAFAKDPRSRPTAAQLAGVDGIRAVGNQVRTRRAARPPIAVSPPPPPRMPPPPPGMPPPPRMPAPLPPRMPAPAAAAAPSPVRRSVPPPMGPSEPSLRQARRDRQAARRSSQQSSRRAPAPPPAPRPRKRRSFLGRLVHRVLFLLLMLAALLVVATLVYSWIRSQLDSISWARALTDLRDQVARWFGG